MHTIRGKKNTNVERKFAYFLQTRDPRWIMQSLLLIIFNCPLFAYKIVLSACADSLLSRIVDYTRTLVGLYFLFVCNVKLLLPPRTRAFFFVSILLTVDVQCIYAMSRLRATVIRFFAFRYLTKSHATVTEFTMIPMRLALV